MTDEQIKEVLNKILIKTIETANPPTQTRCIQEICNKAIKQIEKGGQVVTDEELEQVVNSGRSSFTLDTDDFIKAQFAIYCLKSQDKENGLARFWPLLFRRERRKGHERRTGD